MSDRLCAECVHFEMPKTYTPCSHCFDTEERPKWMPNGKHALRIRAEQAEARASDAYAALEWLRCGQIVVYTSPSGEAPYAWQAGSIQTERDFYAALSAATGRTLEPPDDNHPGLTGETRRASCPIA